MRVRAILIIILTTAITVIFPFLSKVIMGHVGDRISGSPLAVNIVLIISFYIVQNVLTVLFVRFVLGHSLSDMGFNLANWKLTIKQVTRFVITWFVVVTTFYSLSLIFISGIDTYVHTYYVKDTTMLLKDFITGCLLAGLGEEPLFRGLVVIMLSSSISAQLRIGKYKLPMVALVSGLLFMIAHIVYEISPFRVVRIDYLQLLITFTLGTVWATFLIKTKSLVGPILAHTIANTIQIMTGYFVAFFILK